MNLSKNKKLLLILQNSKRLKQELNNRKKSIKIIHNGAIKLLKGQNKIHLQLKNKITLIDNQGNKIKNSDATIQIDSSNVQFNKIGEYKIMITAKDKTGAVGSRNRKVYVVSKKAEKNDQTITKTTRQGANTSSGKSTSDIIIEAGEVYVIDNDFVLSHNHKLTIKSRLVIKEGATFTDYGTITNNGDILNRGYMLSVTEKSNLGSIVNYAAILEYIKPAVVFSLDTTKRTLVVESGKHILLKNFKDKDVQNTRITIEENGVLHILENIKISAYKSLAVSLDGGSETATDYGIENPVFTINNKGKIINYGQILYANPDYKKDKYFGLIGNGTIVNYGRITSNYTLDYTIEKNPVIYYNEKGKLIFQSLGTLSGKSTNDIKIIANKSYTISSNFVLSYNNKLTIESGGKLIIESGATFTDYGTVKNNEIITNSGSMLSVTQKNKLGTINGSGSFTYIKPVNSPVGSLVINENEHVVINNYKSSVDNTSITVYKGGVLHILENTKIESFKTRSRVINLFTIFNYGKIINYGKILYNDSLVKSKEENFLIGNGTIVNYGQITSLYDLNYTIEGNPVEYNKYILSVTNPSITEGDSGTSDLTFTLTLNEKAFTDVTINYRTLTTGTAKADDFTATNGTVNIGKDKKTTSVNIKVKGDNIFEENETVRVKFSGTQLKESVTATGTITNDDSKFSNYNNTKFGINTLKKQEKISAGHTAFGVQALYESKQGSFQTAFGKNSLLNSLTGFNTAVGIDTGLTLTTGRKNTLIGNKADVSNAKAKGELVIGDGAVGHGNHIAVFGGSNNNENSPDQNALKKIVGPSNNYTTLGSEDYKFKTLYINKLNNGKEFTLPSKKGEIGELLTSNKNGELSFTKFSDIRKGIELFTSDSSKKNQTVSKLKITVDDIIKSDGRLYLDIKSYGQNQNVEFTSDAEEYIEKLGLINVYDYTHNLYIFLGPDGYYTDADGYVTNTSTPTFSNSGDDVTLRAEASVLDPIYSGTNAYESMVEGSAVLIIRRMPNNKVDVEIDW